MTQQLNEIAGIWWNWMWPMFWQVSLLIVLVGAVDVVLRKRIWPQLRYALWLLVLVKLVIPPTFALPTGLIPRLGLFAEQPSATREAATWDSHGDGLFISDSRPRADLPSPPAEAAAPIAKEEARHTPVSWRAWAMIVWLLGGLMLITWLIAGYIRLSRIHCGQVDDNHLPESLSHLLSDTAERLHLKHLPRIVVSGKVESPAVFGTFRPVLLLPATSTTNLSRRETEHILLHELAHLKRRDLQVHAVCVLLQIVYWFNPLVYLVRRHLQHVRELCCDATVAKILKDQTQAYCQTILETAAWMLNKPNRSGIGFLGLVENPGRLLVRLSWLRKGPSKYPRLRLATVMTLVAAMFTCVLPMASAQRLVERDEENSTDTNGVAVKSLHEAAESGDLEQVKSLIAEGADINASQGDKTWTPLAAGARAGHAEIVRVLLTNGAEVDLADSYYTPLYYAIWADDNASVKALIAAGANVNVVPDAKDFPPLAYAIWQNHVDNVKALLDAGAALNYVDERGHTPLYWAAFASGKDVLDLILTRGDYENTAYLAACKGQLDRIKAFVNEGMPINTQDEFGCTLLHWAVQAESTEVASYLLAKGADISVKDRVDLAPLMVAHTPAMIELLIAHGADIHAKVTPQGRTRLHTACYAGNVEIVRLLVDKGADIEVTDNLGMTPLYRAATGGHVEIAALLIEKGAEVNVKTNKGRTPLWMAAGSGYVDMVKLLIAKGANINAADNQGRTPLTMAQREQHTETVDTLRQHGANEAGSAGDPKPEKSLHEAARDGDLKWVKQLIAAGAAIDEKDKDGATPLHFAAHFGQTEVARFLLAKGADVNCETKGKGTPLCSAAWFGYLDILDLLIEAGAGINAVDSDGWTPVHYALGNSKEEAAIRLIHKGGKAHGRRGETTLHLAVQTNCYGVVEELLARGEDANIKDGEGNTPLHLAARYADKPAMLEVFIAKGIDVAARNNQGRTALHGPLWHSGPAKVELLVAGGADINAKDKEGLTPLHIAARMGAPELVQALLAHDARADVEDNGGVSPVHEALRARFWRLPGKYLDVVDLLLAKGAERSTIYVAAYAGDLDGIRRFLEQGTDVNTEHVSGLTPLHAAAKGGREEAVEFLIANGAQVDAKGYRGRTALHYAADMGHEDVVKALVAQGADVNAKCSTGQMPLHYAAFSGHHAVVQQLIAHGAEVDANDALGRSTPLYYAIAGGHEDIVRLLLDSNVDIHARRVNGATPLHLAAQLNQRTTAELLLAKGADVNARDNLGQNPFRLATRTGQPNDVAVLLLKHGAEKW